MSLTPSFQRPEREPHWWNSPGPKPESPAGRRRWNYFKDRLREQFGETVYKVGIDAGFDCPNRDGTKGWGGCAYCSQKGSFSPHQDARLSIRDQFTRGQSFARRRYKASKNIVYFQAFTNTYAPVDVLRERYESALVDDSIVGMSVATRPDCINEENAALLAEYARRLPWFACELGLQSAYQNRLEWVNRLEEVEDYVRAMEILNRHGVPVITHVIVGFPGETAKEISDTVALAQEMKTWGVKLQMLHVIKGTKMAWLYNKEPFPLLSLEEYGEILIPIVERLDPKIQIHRITGETSDNELVAPDWVRHKTRFFEWFEGQLELRNTWQGRLFDA
jgi:radical SAM protein (TIGR01212 family)